MAHDVICKKIRAKKMLVYFQPITLIAYITTAYQNL